MFVTKGFLLAQTFSKSNVGFYCGHSLSMELTQCKYIKSYSALFCSLEHDQDDSDYLYQVQEHMLSCVVSCSYTCDMVEWMAVWVRMCVCVCVCVLVTQLCTTLCNPMSPRLLCPWNSSGKNTGVGCHSHSGRSSQLRDWTQVSCIAGRFFTVWATMEIPE